jgi:hypothetical protein
MRNHMLHMAVIVKGVGRHAKHIGRLELTCRQYQLGFP